MGWSKGQVSTQNCDKDKTPRLAEAITLKEGATKYSNSSIMK